ncbi:phosphotransferase [Paenibacillus sp. TRM 82003]|nr:phosphotransferase [Paenibacillus sp. TRM 82003]
MKSRVGSLGYDIIDLRKRQGPFASSVYDLVVADAPGGEPSRVIYKETSSAREDEARLFSRLGAELSDWTPGVLHCFLEPPFALLMRYGGEPFLHSHPPRPASADARCSLLSHVSERLGQLHLRTERDAERWVREGIVPAYRYSREWADWSIARLDLLEAEGTPALEPGEVRELEGTLERFYARYDERSMRGPRVMTHGDTHWGNVIRLAPEEPATFIDWEWHNVSTPMRDISILLLEEPDEDVFDRVAELHMDRLLLGGYSGMREALLGDFARMMVDNALMMLGWDAELYVRGERTLDELRAAAALKRRRALRFWKLASR